MFPAYWPKYLKTILGADVKETDDVIFVVCGGTKVSLEEMEGYRETVEGAMDKLFELGFDGRVEVARLNE